MKGRRVSLSVLRSLPPALRRLVVQRLADDAASGFAPGAGGRAEEIAALSDRGTAMLDVGNGLRAIAEYGALRFEPLGAGPGGRWPGAAVVLPIPGSVSFGRSRCAASSPSRRASRGCSTVPRSGSKLVVRSWRPGDRMAPLGLGGTKSLQDLFTARRVPRLERGAVPVVESGGEIAWVAGVATSERFKVTPATREAVRLSCRS